MSMQEQKKEVFRLNGIIRDQRVTIKRQTEELIALGCGTYDNFVYEKQVNLFNTVMKKYKTDCENATRNKQPIPHLPQFNIAPPKQKMVQPPKVEAKIKAKENVTKKKGEK